jgi:hypothetical protein
MGNAIPAASIAGRNAGLTQTGNLDFQRQSAFFGNTSMKPSGTTKLLSTSVLAVVVAVVVAPTSAP